MREPELSPALIQRMDALEAKQAGIERAVKDVAELSDRVEKTIKTIDMEWTEWYDKFRLLYARLLKRDKDNPEPPQSTQDAPGPTNPRAVAYDRPFRPAGPPKAGRGNY